MTVTRGDRDHFTSGQCHSLAVLLHHLTGFPLAVTGWDYHAFIIIAPGTALDVNGVQRIREITREWGGGRHRRVTEDYFRSHGWPSVQITKRTRRVAKALLLSSGVAFLPTMV
jgi:hypothetical protein